MPSHFFFRVINRKRAGDDALVSREGRFNSEMSAPTCYGAFELETAWAEVKSKFGDVAPNPEAFRALRVTVDEPALADVGDFPEAPHLMVDPSPKEARGFADQLRSESEWDGLVFPSMRLAGGRCVALFLEKLTGRIRVDKVPDSDWQVLTEEGP